MESVFLLVCSLLIGSIASNAALLPAQEYWHTVLPNTQMPAALSDLLNSDTFLDSKTGTYVYVGKGRVDVHAGMGKPGATTVGVGKGGVHVVAGQGKPGGTTVGVGKGGVYVNTGKGKPGGTTVGVGGGRVDVGAGNGKPGSTTVHVGPGGVTVNVKPKNGRPPVVVGGFAYYYPATEEQLQDNLAVNFFFLEQDLHPGSKMNTQFEKMNDAAKFLPKTVAESIPFSSKKLPEIINQFSVQPGSDEEEAMKETLRECEHPASKGEKKMCGTSLESMVDFSVASLGTTNIKAVSTTVHSKNETAIQEYTVVPSGVKNLAKDELVACHQQPYAYAVFYCHLAKSTKGYTLKMTGKDGVVVDAVAVCHTDTSEWNPKHVAFQVLKVKPGTVPVCHFLPQDHVVFTRNN